MLSCSFHVRLLYSRKRSLLLSISKSRVGHSTVCPDAMEGRKYLLLLPQIKLRCSLRVTPSTVTLPTAFCFAYCKPTFVFLPETLHTFLALLYRQFLDKNSAIVGASRWFIFGRHCTNFGHQNSWQAPLYFASRVCSSFQCILTRLSHNSSSTRRAVHVFALHYGIRTRWPV